MRQRLSDYIQYLRFEKRYAQHTLEGYQRDLLQFIDFSEQQFDIQEVTQVTHFHIRSWMAGLKDAGQTERTLNRKLSSLTTFYKYLLKLGIVDKNPVSKLHAQRLPERLPTFLKESETELLLEEVDFGQGFKGATDRLICTLLY